MDRYFLRKEGFSLTEIAIGLGVVSVLLLSSYPVAMPILKSVKNARASSDLYSVAQASQEYYLRFGHWPLEVRDLQPYFLSPSVNSQNYILSSNANTLSVSSSGLCVTAVRPRGITARLDIKGV